MEQTALITGASIGIGLELSKLLAADGYRLALVSRDEPKLNAAAKMLREIGSPDVRVLANDLSHPGASDRIFAESGDVDILINNAGFGVHGLLAQTDAQKHLDLLQVNITALTHLTRLFLPGMITRGRGRIMNLASVAAFAAGPLMSTYYASKAYVVSFSLAVSEECRGTGVTVTAVCPGATRTEFFTRAGIADSGLNAQMMSAETVARIGYRAMLRGRPLVVTGWANKLLVESLRLAPRTFVARVAGKRNKLREA
jgi:uncharacterized protein